MLKTFLKVKQTHLHEPLAHRTSNSSQISWKLLYLSFWLSIHFVIPAVPKIKKKVMFKKNTQIQM